LAEARSVRSQRSLFVPLEMSRRAMTDAIGRLI
jgi:hypothetical protein